MAAEFFSACKGWLIAPLIASSACYTGLPPGQSDDEGTSGAGDTTYASSTTDDSSGASTSEEEVGTSSGGEAEVPSAVVPAERPLIATAAECRARPPGTVVHGSSPAGHLWLARAAARPHLHEFTVIDPWTLDVSDDPVSLEIADVEQVHPFSDRDAAIVALDGLWAVQSWSRIAIGTPELDLRDVAVCGDPLGAGQLLSGGRLYERRDGAWWSRSVDSDQAPEMLVAPPGACLGPSDRQWLANPGGVLWSIGPDGVTHRQMHQDAASFVAAASAVAVLRGPELWIKDPSWQRWSFEVGAPDRVIAGPDAVWVAVGEHLLRYRDGEFDELPRSDERLDDLEILPDAAGLWLVGEDELCRYDVGPQLRIQGLAPFDAGAEPERAFSVTPRNLDDTPAASLDGASLELSKSPDAEAWNGVAVLSDPGWHELVFSTQGSDDEQRWWLRKNVGEDVGFESHIAELSQRHCSGAQCHDPGNELRLPPLDTFEAWTELADKIEARVVEMRTMPPAAAADASGWTFDEVETVEKWLSNGGQP